MHKPKRGFFVFLFLLAVLLSLTACGEPATSVSGTVKDSRGTPIAGVKAVMESERQGGFRKESEQTTSANGEFNFVTITGSASRIRMTFSKDGYKQAEREIEAGKESRIEIVLEVE